MATKRNSGRPRFGYSGCGTDAVVFTFIGVVALWGIHYWNLRDVHPFHLGKVPMPAFVSRWPKPIRNWLRPEPFVVDNEPIVPESPQQTPSPTPAGVAPAMPTPAPTAVIPVAQPSTDPPPPLPAAFATPSPDSGKSQVAATVTKLAPKITDSPNTLQASATVIAQRNGILYLGLPDGGIAISGNQVAGKPHGTVVRLPIAAGAVRAITAGGDGTVWWLAGTDGHLYSYRPADKLLRSLDLTMLGTGVAASDDVAVLPGTGKYGSVVLLGKGETTIVDGESGAVRDLSGVFPHDVASALDLPVSSAFLSLDPVTKEMRLLILGGAIGDQTSMSVWSSKSGDRPESWTSEPIFSQNAPAFGALRYNESGRSCVGFGPGGIALLAKPAGGETLASCVLWTTPLTVDSAAAAQPLKTLPDGVFGLWAAPERIAIGRSGLWWTFGGTIFHAILPGGKPEAYLPWNGAGDEKHGKIANILADDKGLWVATDTGVHRIVPGHPAADVGYGGYLRAPLGADVASAPANPTDQKLAQLTQEWQGVKYKWGGDSKQGIDCSGYVCKLFGGVGITVPRATGELANGTEGKRVRGDLQYGDVLIFPGHCGMYLGNGWTTEALDAGVGKAAIWSRKNVVVKRFLK